MNDIIYFETNETEKDDQGEGGSQHTIRSLNRPVKRNSRSANRVTSANKDSDRCVRHYEAKKRPDLREFNARRAKSGLTRMA